MRKVKRKKRGPRRPLTFKRLVMITAILAISAILLFLYLNRPNEIDKLNTDYISTMNRNIVKEKVKTSYPNTFKAADYTVYGETLALYGDEYGSVELDPFLGKAVQLQNVETGEQYSFTFSGKGDAAIQLGELSEGIYDIYIYDQYTKKGSILMRRSIAMRSSRCAGMAKSRQSRWKRGRIYSKISISRSIKIMPILSSKIRSHKKRSSMS